MAREGHRFNFFQMVRLIERTQAAPSNGEDDRAAAPVGEDFPPAREAMRFRTLASLGFAPAEVARMRWAEGGSGPAEVLVPFLGLTGPVGALPNHYTETILSRAPLKDTALRAWLDLFHHRLISLFYRAWEKYRFPFGEERYRRQCEADPARSKHIEPDLATFVLRALVGRGTAHLAGREAFDDQVLLYYAGWFAQRPRSAVGLQALLQDYFDVPITVVQFAPRWLYLDEEDQTRIGGDGSSRLGVSFIAGRRIREVRSAIRLRVGPVDRTTFDRLLPGGSMSREVVDLARAYLGVEWDLILNPVLAAESISGFHLTAGAEGSESTPARLGWTTWSLSGPAANPADDVSYLASGDALS